MPNDRPQRDRLRPCWLLLAGLALSACEEPATRPVSPGLHVPPFTVLGRWEDPTALRYELDSAGCPFAALDFERTVERALRTWSETGQVGFQRAERGQAQLHIRWDDGADPATSLFGRDTSVALTRGIGSDCEVLFDGAQAWSLEGGADVDFYQTAVHEIGHALGLGHSEDERSVMYAQRENGRTVLGTADLAGIHTLYGGGSDGPGDLRLGDGELVLRRVAPAELSEWCFFDTDGDGDDEILIWSLLAGHGSFTVYHFAPGPLAPGPVASGPVASGPVLASTFGPMLGVAGYGARVHPWVAPDGARHLDVTWPDGSAVRRRFDSRGAALEPESLPDGELVEVELRRSGDLDGDGRAEAVLARR